MQTSNFTKTKTQTPIPFISTAKNILGNMFKTNKVYVSNETTPPCVEEPLVYDGKDVLIVANKSENLMLIMRSSESVKIECDMLDVHVTPRDTLLYLRVVTDTSSYYVQARRCMDLYYIMYNAVGKGFWLTYHGKPLPQNKNLLTDYNIHTGDTIVLSMRLVGGMDQSDEDEQSKSLKTLFKMISIYMEKLSWIRDSQDGDWFLKNVENFSQIVTWSRKCNCTSDFYMLFCLGYKLHTGKSSSAYISKKLDNLFNSNVQSGDFGDVLSTLRRSFDSAISIGENPVFAKLVKLYSSLLVHGYLEQFGMILSDEEYSKMEIRALESQYGTKRSMWIIVVDVALTICERLYEWKLTGDMTSLIHTNHQYELWSKEADRILSLSNFTSNLEAHNTTYFSYIADLNSAIEKGEAYVKFSVRANGVEPLVVKKKVYALLLVKNTEVTRRAAQKERRAPFGVLIHGCSSVAKSSFTKMLYYYYGDLFGLDKAEHFRYVRSPSDEYWSNFDSSKWCIQMDDIAFLLPQKSSEVDPTLLELLNVVNNVPYVPPQAALEDKGKTPVLAKLVLATTNAKDLNANEYFYCPLAVRRRLPFVVHVTPKKEFLHENQRFIEPTSLHCDPGEFPDYWEITVQKIIPVADGRRDRADLVDVAKYSDVNEFLKDFAKNAMAHEQIQNKAMVCDDAMMKIALCKVCHYNTTRCTCMNLQATDIVVSTDAEEWYPEQRWETSHVSWYSYPIYYFFVVYTWWIEFCFRWRIISWWLHFRMIRKLVSYTVVPYMLDTAQIKFYGMMNGRKLGTARWRIAVACLATLSIAMTFYFQYAPKKKEKTIEKVYTYDKKQKCPSCKDDIQDDGVPCKDAPVEVFDDENDTTLQLQGNMYSTTEDQLEKETSQNVWYDKSVTLTQFDVPVSSCSLIGLDGPQLRDKFAQNCVRVVAHRTVNGVKMHRSIAGVMIKGHYCLTNNHTLPQDADEYIVTIIRGPVKDGITPNITLTIRESDIIRMPSKDICLIKLSCIPPFKDITKFWGKSADLPASRCLALRRTASGELNYEYVHKMLYFEGVPVKELDFTLPAYIGNVNRMTQEGDCGALYMDISPRGPIILGIHSLGHETQCGATCVVLEDVENLITRHQVLFGGKFVVQGGGHPMFSCSLKTKILTEPHPRSLLRYLPRGNLHVYGSFAGFRAKPKSAVCQTPLSKKMLEHFDVPLKHGRPNMGGWDVWKKNVVKAIEPQVNYDRKILKHCVDSFTADILRELPDGWEKQLVTLSDRASVNGLPGVKFIDRLNTNTSMGFPWACTKKRFLEDEPDEVYPEGVNFTKEIWERVEEIRQKYAEGRRAYPVFTGHLKEEVLPIEKIEAGKVRLFSGAPADWTLVVRSELLSFIRLVQKNKFVFEAGPGTVCQSTEWTKVHEYLTRFGPDRMVAGDYAAFDKKMLADFILAAFEIICDLFEKAGHGPDKLLKIMCIAEDIAFPVTEINGDLVEFFGSNPSGHALTVIINSLVNSLYARYVFTVCHPEGTCADFKKFVALFTYGDDNVMGISKEAPWFHHTALQDELAKIGVTYTMADKKTASKPYIHIDEVSFLKRSWVLNKELGFYFCPIEEESIHKSLTMWVPSKTICADEQMVAVISGANTEYFFHGRETFEKHHVFFKNLLQQEPYCHYVGEGTLPIWERLVERFNNSSGITQNTIRVEDTSDGLICPSEAEVDC
jgi:hypothetical protein